MYLVTLNVRISNISLILKVLVKRESVKEESWIIDFSKWKKGKIKRFEALSSILLFVNSEKFIDKPEACIYHDIICVQFNGLAASGSYETILRKTKPTQLLSDSPKKSFFKFA